MACLYPRLGLFAGLPIYHHGLFVLQTGFIYWFTHQSSCHVNIPDWVYFTGLLINYDGMFVSQTGFIYWFTHQLLCLVCIPGLGLFTGYPSIIMVCLYPRLGLFTGLPINHDGIFVSQTGFIYWFTHQSSWRICIPDCVYLLVYSSIILVSLYHRLGLFTGLLINYHGLFVSQTGFIYWFTHQSSWLVCILDWVYLLVNSSIIMACLYPRLGLFTGLLINYHGVFVS